MTCRTFISRALAALLLTSGVVGHMIMSDPIPFANDEIDSAPLAGGQFPCKQQHPLTGPTNKMAVGDTQTLKFRPGGAVHGGGSCQLSITLDTKPTEQSVFKVIHSIEGGCPGLGTVGQTFDYKLPASVPNGAATFAWSWIPQESGGYEYYMNCAAISVTGGAQDTAEFDKLPDMLVANIEGVQCKSNPYEGLGSVEYPDPGTSLVKIPDGKALQKVTGSACGASVGGSGGSGGSSNSTSTATQAPSSAPTTSKASNPSPSSTLSTVVVSSSSAPQPTSDPSTGGSQTCSGATMLCNGTSQFGLCANGKVVWQAVAPGTQCKDGQIVRRSYRRARRDLLRESPL
jgi:hypothetical protein